MKGFKKLFAVNQKIFAAYAETNDYEKIAKKWVAIDIKVSKEILYIILQTKNTYRISLYNYFNSCRNNKGEK